MNQGFFGIQYGEAIRPYRVNFRINPGASQYAGEALVIGCTDLTGPTLVSRGSGAPVANVLHYVLQLPYSAGRAGQVPTAVAPFCFQIPDGGLAGGNARGVGAVDLQTVRNAATQVASGANSFAAGGTSAHGGCTASGTTAIAMGANAVASNSQSVCIGTNAISSGAQSVALGLSATASGNQSFAVQGGTASASFAVAIGAGTASALSAQSYGQGAASRTLVNSIQWAMTTRAASGDRNVRLILLCAVTTNATATVLTTNGSAEATTNTWVLPNNCTGLFQGWIVARNTANNDSIGWKFEGMVSRDGTAASVALLGTATPATVGTGDAGMSTCALAVGVNTTNGSLIVTATGIAATTIAWHGAITPAFENA